MVLLLDRFELSEKPYLELGKKQLNKLAQIISNDSYVVRREKLLLKKSLSHVEVLIWKA